MRDLAESMSFRAWLRFSSKLFEYSRTVSSTPLDTPAAGEPAAFPLTFGETENPAWFNARQEETIRREVDLKILATIFSRSGVNVRRILDKLLSRVCPRLMNGLGESPVSSDYLRILGFQLLSNRLK